MGEERAAWGWEGMRMGGVAVEGGGREAGWRRRRAALATAGVAREDARKEGVTAMATAALGRAV